MSATDPITVAALFTTPWIGLAACPALLQFFRGASVRKIASNQTDFTINAGRNDGNPRRVQVRQFRGRPGHLSATCLPVCGAPSPIVCHIEIHYENQRSLPSKRKARRPSRWIRRRHHPPAQIPDLRVTPSGRQVSQVAPRPPKSQYPFSSKLVTPRGSAGSSGAPFRNQHRTASPAATGWRRRPIELQRITPRHSFFFRLRNFRRPPFELPNRAIGARTAGAGFGIP